MKVCFLGKYPPIEGGVSANNYWLAYGLAERAHQVYVVTNADEVEDEYRMYLGEDDRIWYEPRFESSGGFVKVLTGERFSPKRMEHIPRSNPFVSKLASVATQTIRNYNCEAIFSFYYEPYAVAGYLASQWTGRPLILKHAGSDLDRLMRVASLATTYKEILKAADAVVTRGRLLPRFLNMGVKSSKIFADAAFWPPRSVFSPEAKPLDVNRLLTESAPERPSRHFDASKPTIGIYGKVGRPKGSFDLVSALAMLRREGLEFNFLAMTRGRNLKSFEEAIVESGIKDCTWILPFLPHWKVPSFIRACTAVCFLERDFPIKIHGPVVPREVLACGTCLILSGEIAAKQFYREQILDHQNMLVVRDPKRHSDLAAALRLVIERPEEARALGEKGHNLTVEAGEFSEYINHFEALFLRVLGQESTATSFDELYQSRAGSSPETSVAGLLRSGPTLAQLMPWVKLLPRERIEEIALRSGAEQNVQDKSDLYRVALMLCDWIENSLATDGLRDKYPYLGSVLQLQRARLQVGLENGANGSARLAVDELAGVDFSPDKVCELKPMRAGRNSIEVLDYDVTPLFNANTWRSLEVNGRSEEGRPVIEKREVILYIQKDPNSLDTELRINRLTKDLLDLCDGKRRTEEILAAMAEKYGSILGQEPSEFQNNMFLALRQLYDTRILVFTK